MDLNNKKNNIFDTRWPFLLLSMRRGRILRHLALLVALVVVVSVFGFVPETVITSNDFPLLKDNTNIFRNDLKLNDTTYFENDLNKTETNLTEFWDKAHWNKTEANLTEFWNTVRAQVSGDFLYHGTFDATRVTSVLRQGKIIYADLFKKQTAMKLLLTFEGGQTAIFKVKLEKRENRLGRKCNAGCEHPENEVVAYTLNRMFDLRNMPYTTGRVVSWPEELEPVASDRLLEFIQVQEDLSICFNWTCTYNQKTEYCFKSGEIPGAVIYFIEDRKIEFIKSERNLHHAYHPFGVNDRKDLARLPGDKRYCHKFRHFPYDRDVWFLDVVDIAVFDFLMSHMDAKHTYISEGKNFSEPEFNVMFDFGHAFCFTGELSLEALAPLIQCCRVRTRLFKAMDTFKDNFDETFISLTRDDPLHPLLLPEQMDSVIKKLKQTLSLIDFCRNLDGDSAVFKDL